MITEAAPNLKWTPNIRQININLQENEFGIAPGSFSI